MKGTSDKLVWRLQVMKHPYLYQGHSTQGTIRAKELTHCINVAAGGQKFKQRRNVKVNAETQQPVCPTWNSITGGRRKKKVAVEHFRPHSHHRQRIQGPEVGA